MRIQAKSKKTFLVVLLSILMSVLAFFGVKTMTVRSVAETTLTTATDMLQNKDKLLPAFNHPGSERLSVFADGTISSWSDGQFYYQDETVYGVDFDISITGHTQFAFALRTSGQGAMWDAYGYYAFVDGTSMQLVKTDANTTAWNQDGALTAMQAYGGNLFDGEKHHVVFSAIEDETSGNVVLTFKVDDGEAITATDEGTALPMAGTAFKMLSLNGVAIAQIYGEGDVEAPTEYVEKDVDDMIASEEVYTSPLGTEKVKPFADTLTSAGDGKISYKDDTIEALTLDMKVTSAGTSLFMAMRATGDNAVWSAGGVGYYFMLNSVTDHTGKKITGIQMHKKSDATSADFTPLISGTTVKNIFDGNRHTVKLMAKNIDENTAVYLAIWIDKQLALCAVDTADVLPMDGTHFLMTNGDSPTTPTTTKLYGANGVDASVNDSDYTFTDVDDMITSGQIYDDYLKTNKITPFLDVITSAGGGRIVYDNATVEAVDLDIRVTAGSSFFVIMRAGSDLPVWEAGTGYYFMFNKVNDTVSSVQVFKKTSENSGAKEVPAFAESELPSNIFDGQKHELKIVTYDVPNTTAVYVKLLVDGNEVFTKIDTSNVPTLAGSKFVICEGSAPTATKLYGVNGMDINVDENSYEVITSKTLLQNGSDWMLNGAVMNGKESIEGNRDSCIALFGRVLTNTMFNFDIQLSEVGNNWVAIILNANKSDVIWNKGFRSNVIMMKDAGNGFVAFSIEYWYPQEVIGTTAIEVPVTDKMNIECGMFEAKDTNNNKYTFIRLAVNGNVIYSQPMLGDAVYATPGYFGFMNYGTAKYTISATASEEDVLGSTTDGTPMARENENGMTTNLSTENFALIMNSFDPYMDITDDGAFKLANRGATAYGDRINFSKLSLDFKFENTTGASGQYLEVAFNKQRQESFVGQKLAENYANYAYALRIMPTGTIYLIRTDAGDGAKILMSYDYGVDTGNNFASGYHTVTVYRRLVSEGAIEFTIFVDNETTGYLYTDTEYYAPNFPMDGFFGFQNFANRTSVYVKNIKMEGTVTEVGKTLKADAVNFVTYYEDNPSYLYFTFDSATYTTRFVEVYGLDENGENKLFLGRVYPKNRYFEIPASYTGKSVVVVSCGFTADGNKYQEIALYDKEEDLTKDETRRIAIKESPNGAYFVYAGTDEEYLPVGANYMGLRGGDHSTFDAETSFTDADYDEKKAESMMRNFAENGGNVLRVFIIGRSTTNPGISGDPNKPAGTKDNPNNVDYYEGLYRPYMENVEHFLRTAKKYGVYVMITLGDCDVPSNSYYLDLQGGENLDRNRMYLSQNGILARKVYAENVMKYFKYEAPDCLNAIFSIELQNEFAMEGATWPFKITDDGAGHKTTEGVVTLPNGKSYDMNVGADRMKAHDEGSVFYINTLVDAIKEIDPDMLVNEGTYTRNIVGNNNDTDIGLSGTTMDARYPCTFDVYLSSKIDFLDVHIYYSAQWNDGSTPNVDNSFVADLDCMNYWDLLDAGVFNTKPLFMGEFGPNFNLFPDETKANQVWTRTVELAAEAGFKGFACWTLDSHDQKECWNILAGDGNFNVFRQLVRSMRGISSETLAGISANNASARIGENVVITVNGKKTGDTVYYRWNDEMQWTTKAPVFTEVGTYNVEYKVVRFGVAEYADEVSVVVVENDAPLPPPPPPEDSSDDSSDDSLEDSSNDSSVEDSADSSVDSENSSETSSENSSDNSASENNSTENSNNQSNGEVTVGGCGGSIADVGTFVLVTLCLLGVAFVCLKKWA